MRVVKTFNNELKKLLNEKEVALKELGERVKYLEELCLKTGKAEESTRDEKRQQQNGLEEYEEFEKAFLELRESINLTRLSDVRVKLRQFKAKMEKKAMKNEKMVEAVLYFADIFKMELDQRLIIHESYVEKTTSQLNEKILKERQIDDFSERGIVINS